jgi:23S rRNA (cytidine2498-2'-O)-methyltransferase
MTHAILTCSEHFTELALNEIRRQHPHTVCLEQLSPQHLLVKSPVSFDDLTRPWRNTLPIYLHHLFPLHRTLSLTGTRADFDCVRRTARDLCPPDTPVQLYLAGSYAYPAVALEQAIHPGQTRSTPVHGRVLSVLVVDTCCYMGVSLTAQNLSSFAGGRPYFDEPVPNRAGLKLLESLNSFHIELRPGEHALDLGAAPGAWTGVLRRRGLRVTTVSPDALYDWVAVDPDVRPFCLTAEDYLPLCDTTYDMLVNDMRLDARDSAKLMVGYAAHLRPGGIAIMTLKLRLENPRRIMDHAYRILRKTYTIVRVRNLVSNRKEMTLYLRKK